MREETRALSVLVVGGATQDRAEIAAAFAEAGVDAAWVDGEGVPEALAVAEATPFHGVLLDVDSRRAEETLAYLRGEHPELPVVVVADERSGVSLSEQGAADRIDPQQLWGWGVARVLRCAVERQQLQAEIAALGLTDPLTGLRNRRGFLTVGRQVLEVAARYKLSVAAVTIGIERPFLPRQTRRVPRPGEIREFAAILRGVGRSADVVGRTGNAEFTVLMIDPGIQGVERMLARLESRIDGAVRSIGGRQRYRWTAGVAEQTWTSDEMLENLLDRSARTMYRRMVEHRRDASSENAVSG